MDFTIPPSTTYSFKRGDQGIVVWAIQRGLNKGTGTSLDEDGDYGELTEHAVHYFQMQAGLTADGVFGPASSAALARKLEASVKVALPSGLLHGFVEGESGNAIGAVNWSVPGGVDCSYVQRRVISEDLDKQDVIEQAFDGHYQLQTLGDALRARHDSFYGQFGATTHGDAWRLASLAHNYPYAAQRISQVGTEGLSDYWRTPQPWVGAIGASYPDGTPVQTPLAWCRFYALGASKHDWPGLVTRYVSEWGA